MGAEAKNMVETRDTRISNVASIFTDASYFLGDQSKGWDCLNSLLSFYEKFGVEFPQEINGWTRENYARRWQENETEGRKVLEAFLSSVGKPVDLNYIIRGDLLIFGGAGIPLFPAIFLGSDNVLINFGCKFGMRVVAIGSIPAKLVGARRLIL